MVKQRTWFGRTVVLAALLLAFLSREGYGVAVSGRSKPKRAVPGWSGDVTFQAQNGSGTEDIRVRVVLVQGHEIAALVDAGPDGAVECEVPVGTARNVTVHIEVPEEGYESLYTIKIEFAFAAPDGGMFAIVYPRQFDVQVQPPPVAASDEYDVAENSLLDVPAPGVLANDTDPDGLRLQVGGSFSGVSHGTLVLHVVLGWRDGSFTYTPDANFHGSDSFTYRAFNGFGHSDPVTVTITVRPPNHEPVAADDAYGVCEDEILTVAAPGLLANDTDLEGDALTALQVGEVCDGTLTLNSDGSFGYTPNADWNGEDSFTYKANDGTLDSNVATVTITVNPVNDAPLANGQSVTTDEDTAVDITLTASDVDGDPLTYSVVTQPAHGALSGDAPDLTYMPALNYYGSDSLTFKANDGQADSSVATVSITVNPVNDPPVADAGPDQTVEGTSPAGTPLTLDGSGSSDPDGNPLSYTWTGAFAEGGGTVQGMNPTVTLPLGTSTITLVVNDGQVNSDPDAVDITVQDTTPPVIDPLADVTVDESHPAGTPVTFDEPTVTDNCDADVDATVDPASGSLFLLGDTTVTCTATDDSGNSATATFTVHVVPGSPENQLDNLQQLVLDAVASGEIEPELEQGLLAKVNAAIAALARGNQNDAKAAMNTLKALINQVEAQVDKKIDAEVAAETIERVNRIVAALGG